jgi:hypothetical protein
MNKIENGIADAYSLADSASSASTSSANRLDTLEGRATNIEGKIGSGFSSTNTIA